MEISYSKFKVYRECPKHYLYDNTIKKDGGPVDSKAAVTGLTIQKVMEIFYNDQMFSAKRNPALENVPLTEHWTHIEKWMVEQAKHYHRRFAAEKYCEWKAGEEDATLLEYETQFKCIIDSIKKHKLISTDVRAELYKAIKLNQDVLTGSIDFVIKRTGETWILDGKNSKWGLKYLDKDQLLWYSMLLRRTEKNWPDLIGWWLFKTGEVFWIDWHPRDIEDLECRISDSLNKIRLEAIELKRREVTDAPDLFVAKPSSGNCRFCSYKNHCKSHQEWKAEKKLKVQIPDLDDGLCEVDIHDDRSGTLRAIEKKGGGDKDQESQPAGSAEGGERKSV